MAEALLWVNPVGVLCKTDRSLRVAMVLAHYVLED